MPQSNVGAVKPGQALIVFCAMTIKRTMVMKEQIHRFLRAARAEVTAP
jgi:hypothetical protein